MDWNKYPQQAEADVEFRCGLCNKAYSRRDLRDRHRRRCAKTFGQERTSKRKSCETCVQMKLRCSLARPACSRCVQMGTVCHYPNANNVSNTSSTSETRGDQDAGPEHLSPLEATLDAVSADVTPTVPIPTTITLPADGSSSAAVMDAITWSPALNDSGFMLDGMGFPDPAPGFMDYLQGQTPFFLTPQEKSKAAHISDDHSLLLSGDPLDIALPPLSSSAGSGHREQSVRRDDAETDGINMFAINFSPDLSPKALRDTTGLSQELLGILRDYPRLMLQPTFWSPFIHHRLYRCSKGGIAEPLGIALACVSAYSSSVESSFKFVDDMINSQRERLVHGFHVYKDRPETCLAALHAVCMYQILGLFDGPSLDGPRSGQSTPFKDGTEGRYEESGKAAVLYGSFLLKMTRLFCKLHLNSQGQDEVDWSKWKFAESLRRNVFLVHMVNILAAEARKLHPDYFEPLDDATILQMPLPAPESMWRACSDTEWRVAREYARPTSTTPSNLQGLLDLNREGRLDITSLQPLTKMILACHMIRTKFHDEEE